MPGTIVIGGDDVPAVSPGFGGFFDGLTARLVGSVKFDWKKINPKELKLAVNSLGDGVNGLALHAGEAFKPSIDVILNADDAAINKAVEMEIAANKWAISQITAEIDVMWPSGKFSAQKSLTADDVDDYLELLRASEKAEGHSAPQFNAKSIELMKANPDVIRLLKKTTQARQLRAATDDTFMQKVIDFMFKYGPYLAQILSVLLLFI